MPASVPEAAAGGDSCTRVWTVQVGFLPDTFRNGMDPLAIFAYLRGLGEMPRVTGLQQQGTDRLQPQK